MRENAGKGVERTHTYVQFAMAEKKIDNPKERCVYKRLLKVLSPRYQLKKESKDGVKKLLWQ